MALLSRHVVVLLCRCLCVASVSPQHSFPDSLLDLDPHQRHSQHGTPWETGDQGVVRQLTHWEQIDDGAQFTATRKFLTIVPIVMFMLTSFYTKYDYFHFCINITTMILVVLPKLPMFHQVRIFGINKY